VDAARLSVEYGFDSIPLQISPWIEVLEPANRVLPSGSDLLYLGGESAENRWMSALDPGTGRLWMVVLYPDPGGTPP
jgi:hypothetical protein